ncbi:hypothetical protein KCP78_22060 [Salmonella enterica subsp. enterica]|nr:hypothetical protein KCP78_22060 [Salmonella enterica subsp. enterica]
MSACICILGVVAGRYSYPLTSTGSKTLRVASSVGIRGRWLRHLLLASALLYLRRQRRKSADADGAGAERLSADGKVASFAAVSGLFILPTYPTLVAAVQMDDTGTTCNGTRLLTTCSSSQHPGRRSAVCFGFPKLGSFYAVVAICVSAPHSRP